jgi:aspartyl-tRNA(Asn)/glutamyl-tRNA(Gln) amidotransferase subunit A
MDEFSLGVSGESSFFGAVKNPLDVERSAGSGGAAAVAARAVHLALAPDICGELRCAAAFCGVPALKPTYGRVSRKGLIDSAPSLEQIGIAAPYVLDLAAALEAIAGHDPEDSLSFRQETPPYSARLREMASSATLTIKAAVPEDWGLAPGLDERIREAFEALLLTLEKKNFQIETVSLPSLSHSLVASTIIRAVETFSSLGNYDGVRFGRRAEGAHLQEMYRKTRTEGFGRRLKEFLTFGALVSAGDYFSNVFIAAQRMRTLILYELEQCLKFYDLLILPGSPTQAPFLSGGGGGEDAPLLDPVYYYTAAANLAGLPALTFPLPCKAASTGSMGVQLIGKAWDEATLLYAALLLEEE